MGGLDHAASVVKLAVEPATLLAVIEGVLILASTTFGELIDLTIVNVGHNISIALCHLLLIDTVVGV